MRDTAEIVSGVLLAAATVASAWCAYQSTLWSGEQIRSLSAANTAHFESLRKTAAANVATLVDVTTFLNYVENASQGHPEIAEFIREHARPEFRPALEAWIAKQKTGGPATALPFKLPQYQVADELEAEAIEHRAAEAIEAANQANARGDAYVLRTVMFALALFFLGNTSNTRRRSLRLAMLAFGALVFTLSLISLTRLPRAVQASIRANVEARAADRP